MKILNLLVMLMLIVPFGLAEDLEETHSDEQVSFIDFVFIGLPYIVATGVNSVYSALLGGMAGLDGDYATMLDSLDESVDSLDNVNFESMDSYITETVNTGTTEAISYDNFNTTRYAYLNQYDFDKNVKLENISMSWKLITSLFIIFFEMIYILFQLSLMFLFVWIFVDLMPQILIFSRDQMFNMMFKRRGLKK